MMIWTVLVGSVIIRLRLHEFGFVLSFIWVLIKRGINSTLKVLWCCWGRDWEWERERRGTKPCGFVLLSSWKSHLGQQKNVIERDPTSTVQYFIIWIKIGRDCVIIIGAYQHWDDMINWTFWLYMIQYVKKWYGIY